MSQSYIPRLWGGYCCDIAGTYLSITSSGGALILQIQEDGTFSMIVSDQFAGRGIIDESYSDTLGTWKWTGWRQITATSVNIAYEPTDGSFIGLGASRNWISFDRSCKTAILACEGAIFPTGVDAFESGAVPIDDSDFTCGEVVFHRIGVNAH